jgi:O-glycosyl hydrolase
MNKKLWAIVVFAVVFAVAFAMIFPACGGGEEEVDPNEDDDDHYKIVEEWVKMEKDPGGAVVQLTFDPDTTYQTIEGFGFFGAYSAWWDEPSKLYSDKWAEMVVKELGISMWRNEIYAHDPVDQYTVTQDSYWRRQRPVVQGLVDKAKEDGTDLRIILTIWTPPPGFKTNNSVISLDGGGLKPESYVDFANWLVSGLDMYKNDIGVDVYGLSFQNEPAFPEPYNSCVYSPKTYADALEVIAPIVREKYPNVKLFGAEDMLIREVDNWNWSSFIKTAHDRGVGLLDAYAIHGIDSNKELEYTKKTWATLRTNIGDKPLWMTETSGFYDDWIADKNETWGAFPLAQQIGVALKHGKLSAWVYWQGSNQMGGNNMYYLMSGMQKGKRYWVSKHYYRYIRPGAKMIEVTCTDDKLMVIPFTHPEEKRFTVVVLNDSAFPKKIELPAGLFGDEFKMYQTTGKDGVNCASVTLNEDTPHTIVVPGMSVVTLVNNNYNPD